MPLQGICAPSHEIPITHFLSGFSIPMLFLNVYGSVLRLGKHWPILHSSALSVKAFSNSLLVTGVTLQLGRAALDAMSFEMVSS